MANFINAAEALELSKTAWEKDIAYVDERIRESATKGGRMTYASVEREALEFIATLLTNNGFDVEKDGFNSGFTIRW